MIHVRAEVARNLSGVAWGRRLNLPIIARIVMVSALIIRFVRKLAYIPVQLG